jgi:hypothetical protein
MAADGQRLEELVLVGRLDELFSLVTLEDLADAWCRYQSRPHVYEVDEEDPDEWAMLFVAGCGGVDELDEPLIRTLRVERRIKSEVRARNGARPRSRDGRRRGRPVRVPRPGEVKRWRALALRVESGCGRKLRRHV